MKRQIFLLLTVILCAALFLPMAAQAQTYQMNDTDVTITLNDDEWYVFTPDNIKDNPELAELGVSYQYMYDFFQDNATYMDAILFYEEGGYLEFFVQKRPLDTGVANLSNYKDSELSTFAKELAKKAKVEDYSVYKNTYKFVKLKFYDSELKFYVYQYVTIVNKNTYTFTFQSEDAITEWEAQEIQQIVDSVVFDVDTSLKEKNDSISLIPRVIGGGVAGGIAGLIIGLKNKKKQKAEKAKAEAPVNSPELD